MEAEYVAAFNAIQECVRVKERNKIDNNRTSGCRKLICDEIKTRLVEANAKSGNANADDDDVRSSWSWIINEKY